MELEPDKINNYRTLVARFFIKWQPNMEAITRTLHSMWRAGGAFKIRGIGDNKVPILFDDEADVNHILMQWPWPFNKYLIGLYKLGAKATVDDATFDQASFWVQIHGLQLSRIKKENAEAIVSTLG